MTLDRNEFIEVFVNSLSETMEEFTKDNYNGDLKSVTLEDFVNILGLEETDEGYIHKEETEYDSGVKDSMKELYKNIMDINHDDIEDECGCCDESYDPFEADEYTIIITKVYKKELIVCAANKEDAIMTAQEHVSSGTMTMDEYDLESISIEANLYPLRLMNTFK